VFYVLFFTGLVVFMVKVSDNWWEPWPGYLILLPVIIGTFWLIPKTKNLYLRSMPARGHREVGTNLAPNYWYLKNKPMG
jgi:hypothetical protein